MTALSPAARKPFVCKAATFSPVQKRLASPIDQKLLSPSTSGVTDSAGPRQRSHGHSTQSELVPEQPTPRPGQQQAEPSLVGCHLVHTWTPSCCSVTVKGTVSGQAGTLYHRTTQHIHPWGGSHRPSRVYRCRSDAAPTPHLTPAAIVVRKGPSSASAVGSLDKMACADLSAACAKEHTARPSPASASALPEVLAAPLPEGRARLGCVLVPAQRTVPLRSVVRTFPLLRLEAQPGGRLGTHEAQALSCQS